MVDGCVAGSDLRSVDRAVQLAALRDSKLQSKLGRAAGRGFNPTGRAVQLANLRVLQAAVLLGVRTQSNELDGRQKL
jgi:hypothetical protein